MLEPDIKPPRLLLLKAPFGTLHAQLYENRQGDGPVAVIWPSIFSTAAVQHRLVTELAKTNTVIAFDPPGHGRSGIETAGNLTMTNIASASLKMVEDNTNGPVHWVGTSWGGLVGIEAALVSPDRFGHLACLNTPFAFERSYFGKTAMLPLMARMMGTTRIFSDGVADDFFLETTRGCDRDAMDAHRKTFSKGNARQLAEAAALIFKRRKDARSRLRSLSVPTLVIAGTQDRMYDIRMQRAAADAIANGSFATVDAAHIAAVDQPEEVLRLLRSSWAVAATQPQEVAV